MKVGAIFVGCCALMLVTASPHPGAAASKQKEPQLEKVRPSAAETPTKKIEPPRKPSGRPAATKDAPGMVEKAPMKAEQPSKRLHRKVVPVGPTAKGPGDPMQIVAPTANQLVQLGSHVEIRWLRTPPADDAPDCGTAATLYAVRLETNESHRIAENRSNDVGLNDYRWLVSTTFFYDIRGAYRIDVVSTSAPAESACRAQSASFRIVSSDEMAEASVDSDYAIGYVRFADGSELDTGIEFDPDGIETSLEVGVNWNREGGTPGSAAATLDIASDVTGAVVSLRTNPDSFDHGNADPSGLIRVSAPIRIEEDQVLGMKRDRFIPLRVQLRFPDASVDAFAHNNRQTARMRILHAPTPYDLELVEFSGFTKEDRWSKRDPMHNHRFTLTVHVRVLPATDSVGASLPDLDGVRATWNVGSDPPADEFSAGTGGRSIVLSTVPGSGEIATATLAGTIFHPGNWWTPSWIEVTIHPPEGVPDPDLSNNTDRYELPTLP